jgi:signal transduction histidine kinase
MGVQQINLSSKIVPAREFLTLIRQIPIFQHTAEKDLECLGDVEIIEAPSGTVLIERGETNLFFWIVLSGELRITKPETDGGITLLAILKAGETFGEVPLLTGVPATPARAETTAPSTLLRVNATGFWSLMGTCPVVRAGVLANMGRRLEAYQALTLHREKLISLGTLAAGLMHELNNPGAAARRAASQLRENLTRLQEISLRFTQSPLTAEQKKCMADLQQEILKCNRPQAMSTLDQADAEEEMGAWLESIGIDNAWKLAPTLVAIGWGREDIECAHQAFPPGMLSAALNWAEALISSLQLVGTVEESISRVSDLVIAVKKYAYDDKNREREIDVHESIQSTLTILAHKFRFKQIAIEKRFAAEMPKIKTTGTGLSQVWTNILDNAIDASPEQGRIVIRTWIETTGIETTGTETAGSETTGTEGPLACIGIADEGAGIPPENRDQIFEPFFTTKPAGVGTGLGLDIAHRIVVGQFGGTITFTSEPGRTEFVVKLPAGE